jgi:nucleoid-associated protein YejK
LSEKAKQMYKEDKENKNKKIMDVCAKQYQLELQIKVDQLGITFDELKKREDE